MLFNPPTDFAEEAKIITIFIVFMKQNSCLTGRLLPTGIPLHISNILVHEKALMMM